MVVKKCRDLDVEGSRGRGRPRKTWYEVVRGDLKKCRDLDVEGSRGRGRPSKTWDEDVRGDLKTKAIHRDLAQDRVALKKDII